MEERVTIERALELTFPFSFNIRSEIVTLEQAHGRILFSSLASNVDDPGFDNSAMDGWAVRAEDCSELGVKLRIIGTSKAGGDNVGPVMAGQACKIMTGAPIPPGANAIVMVEDSESDGDIVTITGPARPNYIRKRGENLTKGAVALPGGTHLTPARLALAGTMGYGELPVVVPPLIAVIGTGDELIPPGEPLAEGQLYESNTTALSGLLRTLGCEPVVFPLVGDDIDTLRTTLNDASTRCDAIITSGGVSMGDWDIVRRLMEEEGEVIFWRMQIRPGGPPLFGTWNDTPVFGLPGNPVSSSVVFLILVAPFITHSCCFDEHFGPRLYDEVRVRLTSSVKSAPSKVSLRRIHISTEGDELIASTPTHQGSGNLYSMVAGNGLTLLPPSVDAEAGDIINALWLR